MQVWNGVGAWVRHAPRVAILVLVATRLAHADRRQETTEKDRGQQTAGQELTLTAASPADDSRPGEDNRAAIEEAHPLEPALAIARESLAHSRRTVDDYTATIFKRERVNGKLTPYQVLEAKIRNRKREGDRVVTPFSVYLRFVSPRAVAGREVIWVEDQNDGKLVAHEGGFKNLMRVKLRPNNLLAMFGQRYPITEIGIENLLVKLLEKAERELEHGECEVKIYDGAKISGRPCKLVEVKHPARRDHFDFYRARIFLDEEYQLPTRYAAWSWPETSRGEPVLEEEYTYDKVRLNVGLTDRDFDPDNPDYNFP